MVGPGIDRRKVGIYLGLGVGLAATTGLFMGLGLLIDRHVGTSPLFTVMGAFVGAALGFYNLYRQAMAAEDRPPNDGATTERRPDELPEDQRTEERETP